MNQSIKVSEIRELSLDEIDTVSGGKGTIAIGPVRISIYGDGSWMIGPKSGGGLLVEGGVVKACPANGGCVPIT